MSTKVLLSRARSRCCASLTSQEHTEFSLWACVHIQGVSSRYKFTSIVSRTKVEQVCSHGSAQLAFPMCLEVTCLFLVWGVSQCLIRPVVLCRSEGRGPSSLASISPRNHLLSFVSLCEIFLRLFYFFISHSSSDFMDVRKIQSTLFAEFAVHL